MMNDSLWVRGVKFGFRLLYEEMAWSYDAVSWLVSLGQWRTWQEAALAHVTGQRVLELGHGPGHTLLALAKRGDEVAGLDLSPFMGRLARRRLQKEGLAVPLVRGQAQALPWVEGVFDTVVSLFPTNYIFEAETLTAVYRVLAANGRLVVLPEGHLTGGGWIQRGIAFLFWLTGQSGTLDEALWERVQRPFVAVGFAVEILPVALPGSAITLIIATKPEGSTSG